MPTNNDILKKLRIAYELKTTDVASMLNDAGLKLSNSEVTAFFRPPNDGKGRFRKFNDSGLCAFLQSLLESDKVNTIEYPIIKEMLDLKSMGQVISEDKNAWLDELIERRRGPQKQK